MIPRRYIEEWKEYAPWPEDAQVEQDLVIERALIQLFADPFLAERLAFRGGTALHKLFLKPQVRYSEDIDLVQIKSEPIKNTLEVIRKQLNFLGRPSVKQKAHNNTLIFRFESEIPPVVNLRLKIEINCREHFTVLGHKVIIHKIKNGWFERVGKIISFEAEEILATKLRALFQRKKGRDLFDLNYALINMNLNIDNILQCFKKYMQFSVNKPPTQKQILRNIEQKLKDPDFIGDISGLIRPNIEYDQNIAYKLVKKELIEKIRN